MTSAFCFKVMSAVLVLVSGSIASSNDVDVSLDGSFVGN